MESVQTASPEATARRRLHRFPHVPFLAGEAALALTFGLLAAAVVRHPGPLPGDVGVALAVQHALLPHRAVTSILEAESTLNFPAPALATLAIVIAIFLSLRRWLDVLIVLACLGATDGTAYLVNAWIRRPRPTEYGLHIVAIIRSSFSFPSQHVVYAVGMFGLFLYLSFQVRQPVHPALIWFIRAALILAIMLMPISRVLEGEHWPSDALGGVLFGAFCLAIMTHIYTWSRLRWPWLLAPDERPKGLQ